MFEFCPKMPMLDQVIDRLRLFGVLECIKKNFKLLEPVFSKSTIFSISADTFLGSMIGEFSESGSNMKELEVNIYKYFNDYIEDCECTGKFCTLLKMYFMSFSFNYLMSQLKIGYHLYLHSVENSGSLEKLSMFITGSKSVPPLGFPNGIKVKFKHGCPSACRCRPTSSTCDLSITFPIHCRGQEDFNMLLNCAVVEGVGFGNL